MDDVIELIPVKQFSMKLRQGWTMVTGYPLEPGDYAVIMQKPSQSKPASNRVRAVESREFQLAKRRAEAEA